VSSLLKPLTGYVPASQFADRVVGPPTALLSAGQLDRARDDPLSFRFSVGRRARASQNRAAEWLARSEESGALRAFGPAMLAYRQTDRNASTTGVVADVSLRAYDTGALKRHEDTIPRTERKMAKYMRTTRLFGNPIALAHRPISTVAEAIATATRRHPDENFKTVDGVRHELWFIQGQDAAELEQVYDVPLYVTDGHHRLAAALIVAHEGDFETARMPAGIFATTELQVAAFARCIVNPALDASGVVDRLSYEHDLQEVEPTQARPTRRFEFGVQIRGRHFRMRISQDRVPADPYEALDVNLLQNLILGPVFGITNPGRDKRLRFVAETPTAGVDDLDVDAWFLPFPASVADVMRVADSGRVMPQKSTWFGPKLPSGLVIRTIDWRKS
jgi:uncharacterized protein (DUF1015 family)